MIGGRQRTGRAQLFVRLSLCSTAREVFSIAYIKRSIFKQQWGLVPPVTDLVPCAADEDVGRDPRLARGRVTGSSHELDRHGRAKWYTSGGPRRMHPTRPGVGLRMPKKIRFVATGVAGNFGRKHAESRGPGEEREN